MSLEDTLANMSIYDAKKYFRKAQNAVYNLTEMEGKVREATNNEPWGTSSTLMEQIAQGTFNFREREEVVGMVFKRFTEKTGSEWRQIYKALQLLEYLIKHGSEKFIDDARSGIKIVQMLEDFHYIDSQGRDQGINVRNRAKALVELLQDDEQLRNERKKARENANKYKGVVGGSGNTAANMNPRAGFTKSTNHGISVSADFDSDDDEDDSKPPKSLPKLDNLDDGFEKFTFKDNEEPTGGNSQDLFGEPITAIQEDDDDDDDDFADFQTALPVASTTTTTPAITTTQPNTLDSLNFGPTPTDQSSTNNDIFHNNNNVMPAIQQTTQQKKVDPFSSLFNTAKDIKEIEPIKPQSKAQTPIPAKTASNFVANDVDDDDDDLFGELESATPHPVASSTQTNKNVQPANEEIDLLSF